MECGHRGTAFFQKFPWLHEFQAIADRFRGIPNGQHLAGSAILYPGVSAVDFPTVEEDAGGTLKKYLEYLEFGVLRVKERSPRNFKYFKYSKYSKYFF